MRLALVQMPNYGSKDENLYKSLQAIEIASKQGADLVLFPEVQLTEFFPQYPGQDAHKYAVTIEGETVKKFCDICRNNKISAVPNLYLLENDRTYDASIFIDKNGEVKGTQKMVHIAQAEPSLMFEWELRVQAFQNSVILAMCNRVGTEGNMCFSGESIVVDAKGDILAKADNTERIFIYKSLGAVLIDVYTAAARKLYHKLGYEEIGIDRRKTNEKYIDYFKLAKKKRKLMRQCRTNL